MFIKFAKEIAICISGNFIISFVLFANTLKAEPFLFMLPFNTHTLVMPFIGNELGAKPPIIDVTVTLSIYI